MKLTFLWMIWLLEFLKEISSVKSIMEILFTREAKNPFILESHLGAHNTFEIPLAGEPEWHHPIF